MSVFSGKIIESMFSFTVNILLKDIKQKHAAVCSEDKNTAVVNITTTAVVRCIACSQDDTQHFYLRAGTLVSWSSLGNAVFAEGEGGDPCCIKSECFIVKESSSRKKQQHFDVSGAGLTQDQSDSLIYTSGLHTHQNQNLRNKVLLLKYKFEVFPFSASLDLYYTHSEILYFLLHYVYQL